MRGFGKYDVSLDSRAKSVNRAQSVGIVEGCSSIGGSAAVDWELSPAK